MKTPLSRLECRACKAVLSSNRSLRVSTARRFARKHEPHGQLYASIVYRRGILHRVGSATLAPAEATVTAHVRSRRPKERPLTPAEKVAGALFADVVDAYERLMEGVEVGGRQ